MKHSVKEWVFATRPWSFPASAMPVLVALTWHVSKGIDVNWVLGILALVNIVIVHAAGNLWSDYFDYKQGVDNKSTYGVKILTSGLFQPREIMRFSLILQAVAVAMGLVMVCLTGLPLLWIGLVGIALSLAYPPLKYKALADILIALCYAFLPMIGTSFIASGEIHWDVLWVAVPVGLITIAILHVNNVRDIETDTAAGITTFPILTGRKIGAWVYCAEIVLPYLWIIGLCLSGALTWGAIAVVLSLPLAVKNTRTMMQYEQGPEVFHSLDEATAQLQLAFSLLLAAGSFL